MNAAEKACLLAAGLFFMSGLLTGVWKYAGIRRSPEHQAHPYVSLAHQASLAYAFGSVLLGQLARFSPYPAAVVVWAAVVPLVFFGLAIASYVLHGWLRDTDNQFRPPHRLGTRALPASAVRAFMLLLIVGEVGGTAVLLWGFVRAQILTG